MNSAKDEITGCLVEKIKAEVTSQKNKSILAPRDQILLLHKERIEKYFKDGLKGSKIMRLLARDGIIVSESGFYRFLRSSCQNYISKKITVRLPELIKLEDIKGDLHVHSSWSDGLIDFDEMVAKAKVSI